MGLHIPAFFPFLFVVQPFPDTLIIQPIAKEFKALVPLLAQKIPRLKPGVSDESNGVVIAKFQPVMIWFGLKSGVLD